MLKVERNVEQNKNAHLRMRIAIISCGTKQYEMGWRERKKKWKAENSCFSNRIKIVVVSV